MEGDEQKICLVIIIKPDFLPDQRQQQQLNPPTPIKSSLDPTATYTLPEGGRHTHLHPIIFSQTHVSIIYDNEAPRWLFIP